MEVMLPEMGEDIKEATVSFWHFDEGEKVSEGDDLVEMVTDKASFNVPSPVAGVLSEILSQEGETAKIGDVIAIIEEEK
ncbi:MAG: hypothetical protein JW946_00500 [Candidatus Omnitrophica bacterium]|nr:hypothetical protein [Candidatus Omnitrophota bacterium]